MSATDEHIRDLMALACKGIGQAPWPSRKV